MDNKQIVQKIKYMCNKKNINITQLLDGAGVRKSLLYDMEKRNAKPSIEVLASIADYLDCSVDYLLGRSNQENIDQNVYTLTAEEQTLINKFRKLPPDSQHSILDYLSYFESTLINESDISIQSDININNNLQTINNQSNPDNDDSINKN